MSKYKKVFYDSDVEIDIVKKKKCTYLGLTTGDSFLEARTALARFFSQSGELCV